MMAAPSFAASSAMTPGARPLIRIASSGSALGLVDRGIGCRIDDQAGLHAAYHVAHLVEVGQVHPVPVNADDFAQRLQAAHQFIADLAALAGHEYLHAKISASASGMPA